MACFLTAGHAAAKRSAGTVLRRRGFAASATARHDDAKEAVKWERITYAGIATCTVLAMYNLSKGHQEFPDPPPYPYLHVRNKDFPWGGGDEVGDRSDFALQSRRFGWLVAVWSCTGVKLSRQSKMATRARKKRRVGGLPSNDDFVDLEVSESDEVMCSQYVDDDFYDDKSSSDDEMLSDDRTSGGSAIRSFNKSLYEQCLRDYQRIKSLKRKMTMALLAQSEKEKAGLRSSDGFTRQSVSKFASVIGSLSEDKKDVIRRHGFGSLLLFNKCFVPKKFSKWLASVVESKSGDLIIHGKVISLTPQTVNLVLGIPLGGTPFPSNYSTGRAVVLSKFDKTSLPQISFFANKLSEVDLSDEEVLICFLVVSLHYFLCLNSNIVPSPRYLGVFEDIEKISSYDWCGFVLRWMLDGVKSFNQGKKAGQRSCDTLGGCMFYLAVMYLDHVDFSHRRIPDSFPRIEVWKLNMIRDYSDLDLKSPSIYGMRPLLDFEKTCYHKALCSQSVPVVDDSDDVQFLKKLEEACGCDVPDDLKAIVLSVIEDHCKSCLSPISIDVVSLGTLPDEFKKLFNKLMHHVYSLKSKSRDLVLKVLKVFADYESGLGDHEVCASRLSPRVAEHGTGIHKTNLNEPCAIYEDGAHSLPKVPNVAVASQVGAKLAVDVDPAGSSLKRSSPCTSKHVRFGLDVPKGIFQDVARVSDGANHSKSVPAVTVDDVIRVGTESDAEVELFSSPNHYVGPTIVMQTIPDSDDDSARITPKLSKSVPCASQFNHSSKVGSSVVVVPVNISSPEVTIVGSRSLSQKLKSMGKKSEDVYNSNVNKSIPGLKSSHQSLSKTLGYPCSTPIEAAGCSSRSDFKIRDSSTGGKVPIHGPRRLVVPSRKIRDEFEIERSKFKVSKSQILNYKAICSLAASRDSGVDAILFGSVRCTFWALGESLKPGGMVNNFVMAAFCYYLFNQASGHPDLSKCHYFFSNIADHLLKDADVASEEILNRALTRSSKNRPLYCSDLLFFPCFHDEHWFVFVVDIKDRSFVFLDSYYALHDEYQADVRDRMIPNFKHWWKRCGLVDMGFNNYKLHYPYVPRQSATNYTDSGVYVMMFLEHWKSPRNSLFTLFKESDIPNLRIKFANDLLLSPKNSGRKDLVTNFEFADNEES